MKTGRLLPLVLTVWGLADVFSRFVPAELFTFRAYEAMTRYPYSLGPCTPNASYEKSNAHGDLPNLFQRPDIAVPHPERYTTDQYGCRLNGDRRLTQPIETLLIGDSFAMGSGVSNEETLSAQLEKIIRRPVYNAGNMKLSMWRINALLDRLPMKRGLVIYECMERNPLLTVDQASEATYSSWKMMHRGLQKCWDNLLRVSPLRIFCQHVVKRMQDDHWLPKSSRSEVVMRLLTNGTPMYFLPVDVGNYASTGPVNIEGVPILQAHLKKRGINLIVVLAPDKYDVYVPLLKESPRVLHQNYLDQLEKALKAKNIPVINLRQFLRKEAFQDILQNQYLYLPDDTHWNPRGSAVAAREVARKLRRLYIL